MSARKRIDSIRSINRIIISILIIAFVGISRLAHCRIHRCTARLSAARNLSPFDQCTRHRRARVGRTPHAGDRFQRRTASGIVLGIIVIFVCIVVIVAAALVAKRDARNGRFDRRAVRISVKKFRYQLIMQLHHLTVSESAHQFFICDFIFRSFRIGFSPCFRAHVSHPIRVILSLGSFSLASSQRSLPARTQRPLTDRHRV